MFLRRARHDEQGLHPQILGSTSAALQVARTETAVHRQSDAGHTRPRVGTVPAQVRRLKWRRGVRTSDRHASLDTLRRAAQFVLSGSVGLGVVPLDPADWIDGLPASKFRVAGSTWGELVLPIPNPIWSAGFGTTRNPSVCFWSCTDADLAVARGHAFDNSARQHRRRHRPWEAIVHAGRPANRRRVRPTEDSSSLASCQPRPRRSAADPIDGSQWAST